MRSIIFTLLLLLLSTSVLAIEPYQGNSPDFFPYLQLVLSDDRIDLPHLTMLIPPIE